MRSLLYLFLIATSSQLTAQETLSPQAKLYELFEQEAAYKNPQKGEFFQDVSIATQAKEAVLWQDLLDQLEQLPKSKLTKADQINYDVFKFNLENRVAEHQFEVYLIPFNAEGGFYNTLTFRLNRFEFDKLEDYDTYLNLLRAFPKYMQDNVELLKVGIEKGITVPKIVAANYEPLIKPYLQTSLEKHFLYEPFLAIPEDWPNRAVLQGQGRQVLQELILPAYRDFDRFMSQKYLPAAKERIGISAIPNGKAYYEHRVRFFTTLDMSPEEVFQTGEQEVARIKAEMEAIIKEVKFEGSFADFLEFLRTDPQFYHTEGRELLKEAAYYSKKIDGQLPSYFGKMPRLPYGVQPVPATIAPNYTAGRYSPGNARTNRAGNYWVNLFKLRSRPLYALPALTLHEAVPGHHLQIALADEMEGQPDFRRSTYISAFGEGWALYCEWLGVEMGIYETPYEHFGRLTYEMWRACRLVVDVGMHYKGWSRQRALDFLSQNTALSIHECNTEIDRYIGWPGQAVSYKIGELKIRALRQKAAAALGEEFNIRDFHDRILANGSIPLFVLEAEIDELIAAQKTGR
ncbi:MAG: DUF885 domain-containing protein [Bacteroidota bacterium]